MMTNRQPASRSLDSAYQLCSFIKASYTIKVAEAYDDTPEIEIEASIELQTFKDAKPVFELGVDLDQLKKYPLLLKLHVDDDKKPAPCEAARFHGDGEVPLIAISKKLAPGLHTIKMKYNMAIMARAGQAISQIRDGLSLRFVMSDLGDRNSQFLGQYLPSNLAFDRYRMKFDVAMTSNRRCYTLITNKGVAERDKVEKKNKKKSGKGKSKSDDGKIINRWKFDTLEYYKASFIWFHLFPSDTHLIHQKDIVIGDKKIWTTVYGSKEEFKPPGARISRLLALYMNRCVEYLNYFIRRYGDFPTNYLTVLMRAPSSNENREENPDPVNNPDPDNMEFAGALSASLAYLKHEICHCYFGRHVSPANGDAAWFDEAVASWEDRNTPSIEHPPQYLKGFLAKSDLGRGMYAEKDGDELVAYVEGQKVIGHIDYLLRANGGMRAFLMHLLKKKEWRPVTNQDLADLLNEFAPGINAGDTFLRFANGTPPHSPTRLY